MVISGLLRWWYVDGWLGQLASIRRSFTRVADKFSIGLLLKTLFAPFRQISADENARAAGGVANVLVDKFISRFIGFFMRFVMIVIGIITLALLVVISGLRLVVWFILPAMPVVGVILMVTVGAPWKLV